jgi:aspartate ammonia-lyase
VAGALLVAPPDIERADNRAQIPGWAPPARQRLPFASAVVASSDDPFGSLRARSWPQTGAAPFMMLGARPHQRRFGPGRLGRRAWPCCTACLPPHSSATRGARAPHRLFHDFLHHHHRIEHDLIGDRELPNSVYYGVHTLRALENFPITGTADLVYPDLIRALASIKKAAALANRDLGLLDDAHCQAIVAACDELLAGKLHDQFVVDVIQGGAGTSTNMNANEVIANRALELMGHAKGEFQHLHPNEHVNMAKHQRRLSQRAQDRRLARHPGPDRAMAYLRAPSRPRPPSSDVLKMGRTQLQDAVPMTLGQEFTTYAVMLAEDEQRLREAQQLICEMNMGATAIGTGITAHPDYAAKVIAHLRAITGIPGHRAQPDRGHAGLRRLRAAVGLKRVATKLSKSCNDLRLLSSGPRAGFGEINLPAVQAGSSIMPGKVNPVIPEVVNQIAYEVIGNDVTVTLPPRPASCSSTPSSPSSPTACSRAWGTCRPAAAPGRPLRARHHRQRAAHARCGHELHRHRHRAQPLHRLRPRHRRGAGRARQRRQRTTRCSRGLLTREQLDAILRPEILTRRRR